MEESEDDLDDWRNIMMSPKGLYSGFAPEQCVTKSVVDIFSCGEGSFGGNDEKAVLNSKSDLERKLENCGPCLNSSIAGVDLDVIRTGGSIAERRAAKFGFNAPKISTPRFRSSSLLSSSTARSPYLIVSAGISPSALLDSPILLPNSQSSPTTGTLTSPTLDEDIQMLVSTSSADGGNGVYCGSSSMFKSNTDPIRQACLLAVEKQVPSTGGLPQSLIAHVDGQSLTSVHPSVDFEFPVQFPKEAAMDNYDTGSPPDRKFSEGLTINANSHSNTVPCIQMQDKNEPSLEEEDSGTNNSLDGDHHKGTYATTGTLRTAEDGYNWRKYGQKQVKGSEYPRSYYKCTHPSCQVKKKVERSHDGHITEIIYKGAHNHPKPQPCRKSTFGTPDFGDGSGSCGNSSVWANIRPGCKDVKIGSEWRTDGMETSVVTEVSDPMSTFQGKLMGVLESERTPEFSSTLASPEDDEEDTTTRGSFSLGDDNDNENDSKRRKKESCFVETTLGSRAVREPRVVIQIESEIDILDDGYRWRKYGQKVVKGNPNPRSYYKCTSAGCTVRKHVERASQNLKFVITTYEGKHNHEVPAARNSTHANSGGAATNTQSALTLPRNPNLPKPEPHVQDLPPHFDRRNFLGNLGGGPSPFYPMKFPILPNVRPYGSFGLSNHHTRYPGGLLPVIPDISIPLPHGFPHSSNLAISSVRPLFTGHQPEESNAKQFLRPKLEQGDESFCDTGMHNVDHANYSSSSRYNHHIARTFPS